MALNGLMKIHQKTNKKTNHTGDKKKVEHFKDKININRLYYVIAVWVTLLFEWIYV